MSQDDSYLAKVMQLQGVKFEWQNLNDGKQYIGLIAQDVEKILPETVMTSNSNEAQKGLSCVGLEAVLVEAIKEQQAQIEALKKEIKQLKARIRN